LQPACSAKGKRTVVKRSQPRAGLWRGSIRGSRNQRWRRLMPERRIPAVKNCRPLSQNRLIYRFRTQNFRSRNRSGQTWYWTKLDGVGLGGKLGILYGEYRWASRHRFYRADLSEVSARSRGLDDAARWPSRLCGGSVEADSPSFVDTIIGTVASPIAEQQRQTTHDRSTLAFRPV
jgi:hypothetical protein